LMEMDIENGFNGGISGKVAIVSGGASGIGKASARLLAMAGAKVAILDIDHERGAELAQEINDRGGKGLFINCDVSKDNSCRTAVERTVDHFGRLDILVNGAGIVTRATVLEMSEATWDKILAVNLKSVFLLSRHAIPRMVEAGSGVIINIASGWGLVGGKSAAAYCASKGGVVLLTKAMALDHGPQNIRVNCICPGDTDTPMLESEATALGIPYDQLVKESSHDRPLGRIGTPADIAQAVLFLASSASAYMTGATLVVDGGALAGSG
jgi:NAD(P)-dependent dehydrogenase (short-subunit alcohol dehydrogenase family)